MSKAINISMLLVNKWRTQKGIARVKEIASSLGIHPTTSGRTSISGKMQLEAFIALFKITPVPVEPRLPGDNDYGSPGGYSVETKLEVPTQLKAYVEVISLVSPAVRLH